MRLPAEDAFKLGADAAGPSVPVAVVALELGRYRGAGDQLSRCVAATLVLNPVLRELAVRDGGRGDDTVLAAGPSSALAVLAPALVPARRGRRPVLQARGRGRWELWAPEGWSVGAAVLRPGEPAALTGPEALALVRGCREARLPVVERGTPGALARCLADAAGAQVALGGARPNQVLVHHGDGTVEELDAAGLLARFDADDGTVLVADAAAADAAGCAGAEVRGRPGLREVQDLFVERYTGCGRGVVLALEPGSGKTVCCAAALAELARRGACRVAVCAVPPRLVPQWRGELARWFPEARVVDVDGEPSPDRPVVVLDGVDRVAARARDGAWWAESPDDLVVDEADLLARPSKRATALWQLRGRARRALALTGTSGQHGDRGTSELVGWALGLGRTVFDDPVGAAGPFLMRGGGLAAEVAVSRELWQPSPASPELSASASTVHARWAELAGLATAGLGPEGRDARRRAAGLRLEVVRSLDALVRDQALELAGEVAAELARRGRPAVLCCDSRDVARRAVGALGAAGLAAAVLDGEACAARFAGGALDAVVATAAGQRGWNLQRASVVVHLDVPLRPGQADQRLGRVVRVGGSAEVCEVFVTGRGGPLSKVCALVADRCGLGPLALAAELPAR